MSRPSVLLVDEPSAGLAPSMAKTVFTAMKQLCATGMTVLVAELPTKQIALIEIS